VTATRHAPVVALAAVAALAVGACGSASPSGRLVAPDAVPTELAPPTLEGNLTVSEYLPGRQAFAQAGPASLVSDGRLWAIRRGETLVGTLQISTVKRDVSVTNPRDHQAILDGVMTGISYQTIDVGGIKVAASNSADRTLYLWFGPKLFEVLQLKGTKVDPDTVAADVISYQLSTGKLGTGSGS
jgi:hypothetical protein